MARHDHMVVAFRVALGIGDDDPVCRATHFTNAGIQPDPVCEGVESAARHSCGCHRRQSPRRAPPQLQQAVIVVEADKGGGRIRQHFGRRGRPDCACHRQQMIVAKGLSILALRQVVAEADLLVVDECRIEWRLPVEADEVGKHRPEAGTDQIARLSEQTPDSPLPEYSSAPSSIETANDISDTWVGTSSNSNSAVRLG